MIDFLCRNPIKFQTSIIFSASSPSSAAVGASESDTDKASWTSCGVNYKHISKKNYCVCVSIELRDKPSDEAFSTLPPRWPASTLYFGVVYKLAVWHTFQSVPQVLCTTLNRNNEFNDTQEVRKPTDLQLLGSLDTPALKSLTTTLYLSYMLDWSSSCL